MNVPVFAEHYQQPTECQNRNYWGFPILSQCHIMAVKVQGQRHDSQYSRSMLQQSKLYQCRGNISLNQSTKTTFVSVAMTSHCWNYWLSSTQVTLITMTGWDKDDTSMSKVHSTLKQFVPNDENPYFTSLLICETTLKTEWQPLMRWAYTWRHHVMATVTPHIRPQ